MMTPDILIFPPRGFGKLPLPRHPEKVNACKVEGEDRASWFRVSAQRDYWLLEGVDEGSLGHAREVWAMMRQSVPEQGWWMEDWADFKVRAYHLDISRGKVPVREHFSALLRLLAHFRYNQLHLYTEHSFAYRGHERVWQGQDPITPEDRSWLAREAATHGIALAGNQNSLGHMERWLEKPMYHVLAESPSGFTHPISGFHFKRGSTLAYRPEVYSFLADLYHQQQQAYPSGTFHVGLDEPWEFGQGRSLPLVASSSGMDLFQRTVQSLNTLLPGEVEEVLFWGDFPLKDPDFPWDLPSRWAPVFWNYELSKDWEGKVQRLAGKYPRCFLAGGDQAWRAMVPRMDLLVEHVKALLGVNKNLHAKGFMMTHWGDVGHWQPWVMSLPGLFLGGLSSWNSSLAEMQHLNRAARLSGGEFLLQLFEQMTTWDRLENQTFPRKPNGSGLFQALRVDPTIPYPKATPETLSAFGQNLQQWDLPAIRGDGLFFTSDDQEQLLREYRLIKSLTLALTGWGNEKDAGVPGRGCNTDKKDLLAEFEAVWLMRNRRAECDKALQRIQQLMG